jgi:hypothetical protein
VKIETRLIDERFVSVMGECDRVVLVIGLVVLRGPIHLSMCLL